MKVKWDRDDHFLQGIENKNALLPQAGCTSSGRFYVVTPPQFMWRTKLSKRSAGEDLRWKTCTMCLVLQLLWKMNIDIYICTLYIIIYNYIYICKYTVKRQCVCVYIYIYTCVYTHTLSLCIYWHLNPPTICNDMCAGINPKGCGLSGGITIAKPMSISTRNSPACDTWLSENGKLEDRCAVVNLGPPVSGCGWFWSKMVVI